MAHDTVGDEVSRARRDVEEGHRTERFYRGDLQVCVALQGLAFDVALPSDGRIYDVEEAEMLPESSADSHNLDGMCPVLDEVFYREVEIEPFETVGGVFDDCGVRVRDAKDAAAVAALCVEDACQETLTPRVGRNRRPGDALPDALDVSASTGTDRLHGSLAGDGLLEDEAARSHLETQQIFARTSERFLINEREAELVDVSMSAPFTLVRIESE